MYVGLPEKQNIGLITGHTGLLKKEHLASVGADQKRLIISGMEDCSEFQKVVIERGNELDIERMKAGVLEAARKFMDGSVGAVILECTNLITFRSDIQRLLRVPVFDMVSLIEFFAKGYKIINFNSHYVI